MTGLPNPFLESARPPGVDSAAVPTAADVTGAAVVMPAAPVDLESCGGVEMQTREATIAQPEPCALTRSNGAIRYGEPVAGVAPGPQDFLDIPNFLRRDAENRAPFMAPNVERVG